MPIPHTYKKQPAPDVPLEQETWNGYPLLSKQWFCNASCRAGYRADLRAALCYGSVLMEFDSGNEVIVGHGDSVRWTHRCPYCGSDKPDEVPA